jgi:hypothetical protein
MRLEMGVPLESIIVARNDPGHMQTDPLQWENHTMKDKTVDNVKSIRGAPALKAKFDDDWRRFNKQVRDGIAVSVCMPSYLTYIYEIILEEDRREEEQRQLKALEQFNEALTLEVQCLEAQVQRLEAQLADIRASQT